MNRKMVVKVVTVIGVLVFIIGVIVLIRALDMGMDKMYAVVTEAGHSFAESSIDVIIKEATNNFRVLGAILSAVGGFMSVMFGYQWYKGM